MRITVLPLTDTSTDVLADVLAFTSDRTEDRVTVIASTFTDVTVHGLRFSPDIDACLLPPSTALPGGAVVRDFFPQRAVLARAAAPLGHPGATRVLDHFDEMTAGVAAYAADVRSRRFPAPEHGYTMPPEELANRIRAFVQTVEKGSR